MSDFEQVEILLVEDNANDAEVTMRALKRANVGNRLKWVKDGAEALEYLFRTGAYQGRNEGMPKLVLLDIRMPKMDGIEVLRRLREHDTERKIPVVMLTSSAQEIDVTECYQLGCNSYIVKPVDFPKLSDEIGRLGFYWLAMNKIPH